MDCRYKSLTSNGVPNVSLMEINRTDLTCMKTLMYL